MNKKIWIGITLTMIIALMQIAISANNPWTDAMKTRATTLLTSHDKVVDPVPDGLPRITLNVPDLEPAEFYNTNPNIAPISLKVEQKNGWIYSKGWRYDSNAKQWASFTFTEPKFGVTSWIRGTASAKISDIPYNSLNLETNENAITVFTCRKYGGKWMCGCSSLTEATPCNKWIIQQFLASESAPTQITPPEIPGGPDTTPPMRSNPRVNTFVPPVILTTGTTQATIKLSTDEAADCRYSTAPGSTYGTMIQMQPSPDDPPDGRTHVAGFPVMSGQSYTYYIKCADKTSAVNTNTDDFVINFGVASASPTTAPQPDLSVSSVVVSKPNPTVGETLTASFSISNTQAKYTGSAKIELFTDEIFKGTKTETITLQPGLSQTFNWVDQTYSFSTSGVHTVKVKIMPNPADATLTNNEMTTTITVQAAQASPTTAPPQTMASAVCSVEIPSTITITDATNECNTRQILGTGTTSPFSPLSTTQTITGSVDFGFLSCTIPCSADGATVTACKDLTSNAYEPTGFTKTPC